MEQNIKKFKFQLNFSSFVKFMSFSGLCAGITAIPIMFLSNISNPKIDSLDWLYGAPFILIGTPMLFTVYGAFMGVIGFPLYKWLSSQIGFKYSGTLYDVN